MEPPTAEVELSDDDLARRGGGGEKGSGGGGEELAFSPFRAIFTTIKEDEYHSLREYGRATDLLPVLGASEPDKNKEIANRAVERNILGQVSQSHKAKFSILHAQKHPIMLASLFARVLEDEHPSIIMRASFVLL